MCLPVEDILRPDQPTTVCLVRFQYHSYSAAAGLVMKHARECADSASTATAEAIRLVDLVSLYLGVLLSWPVSLCCR